MAGSLPERERLPGRFLHVSMVASEFLNASRQDLRSSGKMGKIEEKEGNYDSPITLPALDAATLADLRHRYDETANVESRTRSQMILLAQQGYKVSQIARLVLRSGDIVTVCSNVSKPGGLDAVLRCTPLGRERTVTAAWEAELLRVIELDPARRLA